MKSMKLGAAVLAAVLPVSAANAALMITEVMSSSGSGGTPDWFELTNTGGAAESVAGFAMDDSSFSFGSAQALEGIATIAPGESVVFVLREDDEFTADIAAAFKAFWGGIDAVQVGTYLDAGTGFSSGGDGVVVFNDLGAEITPRAGFGAATAGVSFGYDPYAPAFGGLSASGVYGAYVSADALANVGSPGVIPEPASLALLALGTLFAARRRRD